MALKPTKTTALYTSACLSATLILYAFSGPAFDATNTRAVANNPVPTNSTLPPVSQNDNQAISILLKSAAVDLENGQLEQAGAALERALRVDPSSAMAWHYLGQVRLHEGQFEQAQSMAQKSDGLDRDNDSLKPYNTALIATAKHATHDPSHSNKKQDKEIFRRELASAMQAKEQAGARPRGTQVAKKSTEEDLRKMQAIASQGRASDHAEQYTDTTDGGAINNPSRMGRMRPYDDKSAYRSRPRSRWPGVDSYFAETGRGIPGSDECRVWDTYRSHNSAAARVVCRDTEHNPSRDHAFIKKPVRWIYDERTVVYYERAPVQHESIVIYNDGPYPYQSHHRHYYEDYEYRRR